MTAPDNPQYRDRVTRLEKWKALGIDPFGQRTDGISPIADARALHKGVEITPHDGGDSAKVAGRIVLLRDIGKLIFITIRDWTGQIQIGMAKQAFADTWPQAKLLELGDIAWFSGKVGHTKTSEVTIWADGFGLLSKALLPPPDKFHGLSDTELRYRQRYVDLAANPDSLDVFLFRCKMIDSIRDFLKQRKYIEVETPMMQSIPGGAAARPFITHHNALDIDLFMRISPELYLKRLLVGGMERVFEINRNFRNEGIDTTHNPEFTMMEVYQAYSDLAGMMELTESLFVRLAKERIWEQFRDVPACILDAVQQYKPWLEKRNAEINPANAEAEKSELRTDWYEKVVKRCPQFKSKFEAVGENIFKALIGPFHLQFGDRVLDFTPPFERLSYAAHFKDKIGVEMSDHAAVLQAAKARGYNVTVEGQIQRDGQVFPEDVDHDVIVGELFERLAEPALAVYDKPVFLYDYPAALCPLTKRKPGDSRIAERFELFVAGMELANAYTELNDPFIQEETFAKQLAGQKFEDSMAKMDEDYINALRFGMPPAGGLGIGIDRLCMVLTNRQTIRDVVLFPLLKPSRLLMEDGFQLLTESGNPIQLEGSGPGANLNDISAARMNKDVARIESDMHKAVTKGLIPLVFTMDKNGSLRPVDL